MRSISDKILLLFKGNLVCSTFTGHYLYLSILQNEIWDSFWILILGTVGCERVKVLSTRKRCSREDRFHWAVVVKFETGNVKLPYMWSPGDWPWTTTFSSSFYCTMHDDLNNHMLYTCLVFMIPRLRLSGHMSQILDNFLGVLCLSCTRLSTADKTILKLNNFAKTIFTYTSKLNSSNKQMCLILCNL